MKQQRAHTRARTHHTHVRIRAYIHPNTQTPKHPNTLTPIHPYTHTHTQCRDGILKLVPGCVPDDVMMYQVMIPAFPVCCSASSCSLRIRFACSSNSEPPPAGSSNGNIPFGSLLPRRVPCPPAIKSTASLPSEICSRPAFSHASISSVGSSVVESATSSSGLNVISMRHRYAASVYKLVRLRFYMFG